MEETMQKEPLAVPKKKRLGKKGKWLLAGVLVVVVLIVGLVFLRRMASRQVIAEVTYQEAAVEVRDISNSLTGSGTLQPANAYTVTTLVSGEILSDPFEEGDIVEKDQLLYVIDSSDASSSQTQAENSYKQALKNKYPTADMTGVISEVYVSNGEVVNAGMELCRIKGDDTISVDFMFSYAEDGAFYVGQEAKIYLDGFDGYVTGTVRQVGRSGVANASGRVMTTVRVTFENPGLVSEDHKANATIGGYTSYGMTSMTVGTSSVITASASGRVSNMNYIAGDTIFSGDRFCTITGENVDNQIESALNSLENAQDKLDAYRIKSPISGTVIEKYAKTGDNAGTGSGGSSLCIIYDLSYLEMTLSIDELDISKVAVGQTVSITADAVPGRLYQGIVTKVSVVGSTSGGTTTYPVTIRIAETDGLLPSMNVDAEIYLSGAKGVLAVPNSAVNRGNTVLVTKDSPSAVNALEQEAPEGYVYVSVIVGESDDRYIEIVSGLQEGDTVAYLRVSSGGMMGGMMMGGMPMGGMPGGMSGMPSGMPSGGMPSGMGGMPGGGGYRR